MKIKLKQQTTGLVKEVKVGFSWTSLFFGILVPLIRGDWKWTIIYFFVTPATFGLFWVIFPFFYNKSYLKGLIESKGYVPADDIAKNILVQNGIISPAQNFSQPSNQSASHSVVSGGSFNSTATHKVDGGGFPPNQISNGQTQASSNLEAVVDSVFSRRSGFKKSYNSETFKNLSPSDLDTLTKKFPPFIPNREKVVFAGLYALGSNKVSGLALKGIIITEKNLYFNLSHGFFNFTRKGFVPLSGINSIKAEHATLHSCYGGGNPGPEISINGECYGWMQLMMMIPDEDEKLLLDVVNEINSSGCLLSLR
jgi:hypothetical protein